MIETTDTGEHENKHVGVIVPHGVLFRGSSKGRIRQSLIEENLLDAAKEIAENDCSLNIPRHLGNFEPEPRVDLGAVSQEITDLKAQWAEVEGRMAVFLRELGLNG